MLGHGASIGYTGPGWAPLTISVWWRSRETADDEGVQWSDARGRYQTDVSLIVSARLGCCLWYHRSPAVSIPV